MYFVTAMTNVLKRTSDFDSEKVDEHYTRCFGYFKNKEDAVSAVEWNTYDLHETIYYYIVIEKIPEGIHAPAEVVAWYHYNKETKTFLPIEMDRTWVANYAIG